MVQTPKKHPCTPRHKRKSTTVKYRNITAEEAAVLIGLINEHCDVTLVAPQWRTKKSKPLYTIVRLVDGSTTTEVTARADELVKATFLEEREIMDAKRALRRRRTHWIAECFRIYKEVLARHDVVVTAAPRQRENVVKTSVVSIATPRGVLDARAIAARGSCVNSTLTALRGCVNVFRIPRGSPAVRDALFPPAN